LVIHALLSLDSIGTSSADSELFMRPVIHCAAVSSLLTQLSSTAYSSPWEYAKAPMGKAGLISCHKRRVAEEEEFIAVLIVMMVRMLVAVMISTNFRLKRRLLVNDGKTQGNHHVIEYVVFQVTYPAFTNL